MSCEYCNYNQDDLFLFTLPCGYLVCYDHIKPQEELFDCFLCADHKVDKKSCLQIKKNKNKLEKIVYQEKYESILSFCNQIGTIKQDVGSYLKDNLSDTSRRIDLKREILKSESINLIDDFYESLKSNLKKHELKYLERIKQDFNLIDEKKIRDEVIAKSSNDSTDYKGLTKFLTDLKSNQIDKHLKNFQNFKNIEFFEGKEELEFEFSKLFGTIDSKYSKVNFEATSEPFTYSKSLSNQFEIIGEVGLKNFLELRSGKVVFISQSNKSNLLFFNPQNGQKRELPGQDEIIFFFKTDKDEILTIDCGFHVKIWYNYKCVYTFDIVPQNFLSVELIKNKLIIINKDHFLTELNCYNGQILNHIYLEKKCNSFSNYSIETFVSRRHNEYICFSYRGFICFNIQTGKREKVIRMQSSGKISTIEKINKDEFIIESETGTISILNADLSTKICKKCHKSSISTFVPCENGLIVSICVDGEIKIWDPKELNLINVAMVKNPIYARILKSGRLVYIDKDFNSYISK
ncbi:hypothetical protein BpHYR1_022546 [Brachionus plicatilis]|uniref:Uncharacterized protein n=1 Tax=Brachionus plicatilis TaxID=10195 RepID=A0A3M7QD83_BRAPC|nr:hypothetical protein BpHYR1_022546 [Brachionus plicatilis]